MITPSLKWTYYNKKYLKLYEITVLISPMDPISLSFYGSEKKTAKKNENSKKKTIAHRQQLLSGNRK